MNVLLISFSPNQSENIYPLSLGYVSSVLKQAGHNVHGIDLAFTHFEKCIKLIKEKDVEAVGVLISLQNYEDIFSYINSINSVYSVPIIAFGAYVSIMKGSLFRDERCRINHLISGETESTFLETIEALEHKGNLHAIAGLIWKEGQTIITNPEWGHRNNLDLLPFPDRTIFPLDEYSGMISRNRRYAQIITSRGCRYHCSYCLQYLIEPVCRKRSPKNVVDEIAYMMRNHKLKEIHIEDANFFSGDTKRIKDICAEIIRRGLRLVWQCSGVIPLEEIRDLSTLDLMAQAGCYNISIGIESFNEETISKMGRKQSFALLAQILRRCRKNKIEVSCHMMIGFPGQSIDQIKEDIQTSRRYPFDFIHYNIFQNLPGTRMYQQGSSLPDHILKRIQRLAYMALFRKMSVIKFLIRRFFRLNNTDSMLKKTFHYLFGAQDLHLG